MVKLSNEVLIHYRIREGEFVKFLKVLLGSFISAVLATIIAYYFAFSLDPLYFTIIFVIVLFPALCLADRLFRSKQNWRANAIVATIAGIFIYLTIMFSIKTVVIATAAALVVAALYIYMLHKKLSPIHKIDNPDERIKALEETLAKNKKMDMAFYYINLSVCYYEKMDYEKALELVLMAEAHTKGKIHIAIPLLSPIIATDIIELNKAAYLAGLNRVDEAESILDSLDKRLGNDRLKQGIRLNRARLALLRRDTNAARRYINEVNSMPYQSKDNTAKYGMLLLQAEIDVIDGDKPSATSKLDEIISGCRSPRILHRANELREANLA